MIDFILAAFPIGLLIWLMTKPRPLPSTHAFAVAALVAYVVRCWYFQTPQLLVNAAVITGLLEALTPITIVFGAIFFFIALEKSGAMTILNGWLRDVSSNPVAQLMLVGWSFLFLIEGASGFGTPAALAAPVLVGLGFPALRVAVLCLIFNTIPTAFGAAGTPIWFGLEMLNLPESELLAVGWQTAILQTITALVLPPIALRMLVDGPMIRKNLVFIYLSTLACVVPMLLVAAVNYEFPTIAGGACGMVITILLARFGVGLEKPEPGAEPRRPLVSRTVVMALIPLIATVFILLVTRIPDLGLRGWMTATTPWIRLVLGSLGEFMLSPSLVMQLRNVLGQDLNWSHAILYVPSIIPFVVTAALALLMFRAPASEFRSTLTATAKRIGRPVIALFGALVFVKLLMVDGERASTMILGHALSETTGAAWIYFAPFLGALGSFFSGSTTISNLMFGGIQQSIAMDTGVNPVNLLAMQVSGAAMGNMICIHNIVAVCAVLSLSNVEGEILKKAMVPVLIYGATLALVAAILF